MNLGFNVAKDIFANPKGRENEIIRICCSAKTTITWNLYNIATIARERCGGQGFLTINKISDGIVGSHSGSSAEGDNRVLMQKIVKDVMTDMQKGIHK